MNKLDLKDLWEKRDNGEITIVELAKEIATRIEIMPCFSEEMDTLEEIAENFKYCGEDEEEFDGYLSELYDWGDMLIDGSGNFAQHKKMCWIATRF